MHHRLRLLVVASVSLGAFTFGAAWSAQTQKSAKKRAAPPKFNTAEVEQIFFTDARKMLVGPRPTSATASKSPAPSNGAPSTTPETGPKPAAGTSAWSGLVSAETLIDEINVYPPLLAAVVKTPSQFKGNGARNARRYFGTLATVFAIIEKYDGDVRWKNQAAAARHVFARASVNAKSDNDNVYNEAKQRLEDLDALRRGETIATPPNIEANPNFNDQVSNRPPLMWRLERAQQDRLAVWTANPGEFAKNLPGIKHEAEIVAALAKVIQHPSYTAADDDIYLEYAQALQKAVLDLRDAAKNKNADAARTAAGAMSKSCSDCHGDFRGG
jgi:hypothetical protein